MKDNLAAIAKTEKANYPQNPFNPHCIFPEFESFVTFKMKITKFIQLFVMFLET